MGLKRITLDLLCVGSLGFTFFQKGFLIDDFNLNAYLCFMWMPKSLEEIHLF